jgi:hypothetical protein
MKYADFPAYLCVFHKRGSATLLGVLAVYVHVYMLNIHMYMYIYRRPRGIYTADCNIMETFSTVFNDFLVVNSEY